MKAEQLKNSILRFGLEGKLNKPHENRQFITNSIGESLSLNIPNTWEVVKFEDLATIVRGGSPRPISSYITDDPDGINWIKIGDTIKGAKYIDHTQQKIKPEGLSKSRLIHKGDFLLSNSMSFGRPYISNITGAIHDGWLAISDYEDELDKNYLYYLLSSDIASKQFKALVTGTTVKNLTKDKVKSIFIPLPHINEQKEIVTKIEELLEKVNQYDNLQKKLTSLNNNFPINLELSILQHAFQGKLVEQRTEEGTARVLLEEISTYKKQLVQSKRIKKDKDYGPIDLNNFSFLLPDTWEWARLNEIGYMVSGGTPKTSESTYWDDSGIIWITPKDMGQNKQIYITNSSRRISNIGLDNSSAKLIPAGSVIFSSRAPIGYINIAEEDFTTNQGCKSIVPFIFNKYVYYALKFFTPEIQKNASGTTFKEISGTNFEQTFIPVPPINEQKRIVEKIELLMELIDRQKNLLEK